MRKMSGSQCRDLVIIASSKAAEEMYEAWVLALLMMLLPQLKIEDSVNDIRPS